MNTKKWIAVAVAVAMATALFASACSDDADSDSSAQQGDVEALAARVQRNEMMNAVLTLGTLGLHDMDEGLNDTGVIESSYVPNTRTAVRLLALTSWDASLQEDADAVEATAVKLLQALEAEDIDTAAPEATALHEGVHELTEDVWAIVAKDLPPDGGGVEEHDEAAETPADGGTQAAGETPEEGDHDEDGDLTPAAEATP